METQHGKVNELILQEDAHISNLEFDKQKSLFAVFDGHGGKEVAHYAKSHFEKLLR